VLEEIKVKVDIPVFFLPLNIYFTPKCNFCLSFRRYKVFQYSHEQLVLAIGVQTLSQAKSPLLLYCSSGPLAKGLYRTFGMELGGVAVLRNL
jgi:hypothetical protein